MKREGLRIAVCRQMDFDEKFERLFVALFGKTFERIEIKDAAASQFDEFYDELAAPNLSFVLKTQATLAFPDDPIF